MLTSVTMSNPAGYEAFYKKNMHLYVNMLEEISYIISKALADTDIRIHSHGGRIKELDHALEKIQRKGYADPIAELEDVIGYRIVCLFTADLERLADIVKSSFTVVKEENKVSDMTDPATFGYMSNHYICELDSRYSGPRYDSIRKIRVEIQCRTILMDAWANVSHHLAYKGDASIPDHLRRDFYALSGLFYVADKHFELFFTSATKSVQETLSKAIEGIIEDDSVNAETLQALIQQLYPDRPEAELGDVSELVEQIVPLGYTSIRELKQKFESAYKDVIEYETSHHIQPSGKYNQVGMARRSMRILDTRYK
jgi:putative GTP pyrophosphokinase